MVHRNLYVYKTHSTCTRWCLLARAVECATNINLGAHKSAADNRSRSDGGDAHTRQHNKDPSLRCVSDDWSGWGAKRPRAVVDLRRQGRKRARARLFALFPSGALSRTCATVAHAQQHTQTFDAGPARVFTHIPTIHIYLYTRLRTARKARKVNPSPGQKRRRVRFCICKEVVARAR